MSVSSLPEAEYMQAVGTCQGIVASATEEYRNKAFALMEQLKAAQDQPVADIDTGSWWYDAENIDSEDISVLIYD